MGKRKGVGQQVEDAVRGNKLTRADGGLPAIEQAKAIIAKAVADDDSDQLLLLRDAGAAYQHYWLRREGGRDLANDAGGIKVLAERGLGKIDSKAHPQAVNDQYKDSSSSDVELLVGHTTRANWRRMAKVSDKIFDRYIEIARDDQDYGVSTAQIIRIIRSGGGHPDKDTTFECYTPAQYIEAARSVLGTIDLDPASSAEANKTVKATVYYTEDNDGLEQDWSGRVWLNPPYGRSLTGKFVTKTVDSFNAGDVTAAIVLINAYGFDAEWFQPLFDHTLCFTDHRIKFYGGGPTFGSLFIYLGPERATFASTFSQFGAVVERRK